MLFFFPSIHNPQSTIMNPGLLAFSLAGFLAFAATASAQAPAWHFEFSGGKPNKLVWQTEAGRNYDLFQSADLAGWTHVDGFPKPGTGAAMEYSFTAVTRGFFRIASEAATPVGFALIPAGSFQMGESNPLVGSYLERPVHSVYVSAFYMAKYEVTKELWDAVRAWGLDNGYTDLPAGNGSYASKGANHPVHSITWYAIVRWCNARSQKEGLAPCYTVSDAIYKTAPDTTSVVCNWSANGYRLPTEAEWEKAARGGLTGKNFPWGDTINQNQENYCVYSANETTNEYTYDVTPRGPATGRYYYHPSYTAGGHPYSSPVGSFIPNGYGLYDMAGNMFEWCWDRWLSNYYASSPGSDPRGPASGSNLVLRGGSWGNYAYNSRVACRNADDPGILYNFVGFRPARSSVP
jgi:formylglycine-generating enzyme required for sulfatase activity